LPPLEGPSGEVCPFRGPIRHSGGHRSENVRPRRGRSVRFVSVRLSGCAGWTYPVRPSACSVRRRAQVLRRAALLSGLLARLHQLVAQLALEYLAGRVAWERLVGEPDPDRNLEAREAGGHPLPHV